MKTIENRNTEKLPEISRASRHQKRQPCKKGANLEFIANYMFSKPGVGSTEIRRALCRERDKPYSRGMYTTYFSRLPNWKKEFVGRYWSRCNTGWMLTLEGMGLVNLKEVSWLT
jgi:hypothetical protein